MNKYIKLFEEKINESFIGKGSIIFIKGKPEKGKRKLFATHITGFVELKAGAIMLFLADDFHRIKEEDGKLKAIKISYKNEDSLKSVLNLKSPGKISVVKNNNKTPFHWKTLKHTNLNSALREIEKEFTKDQYILESANQSTLAKSKEVLELGQELTSALLRAINGDNSEIKLQSFSCDDTDLDSALLDQLDGESSSDVSVEWDSVFYIIAYHEKFDDLFKRNNIKLEDRGFSIELRYSSNGSAWSYQSAPQTFHHPAEWEEGVENIETDFLEISIVSNTSDFDHSFSSKELSDSSVKELEKFQEPISLTRQIKKISNFHPIRIS